MLHFAHSKEYFSKSGAVRVHLFINFCATNGCAMIGKRDMKEMEKILHLSPKALKSNLDFLVEKKILSTGKRFDIENPYYYCLAKRKFNRVYPAFSPLVLDKDGVVISGGKRIHSLSEFLFTLDDLRSDKVFRSKVKTLYFANIARVYGDDDNNKPTSGKPFNKGRRFMVRKKFVKICIEKIPTEEEEISVSHFQGVNYLAKMTGRSKSLVCENLKKLRGEGKTSRELSGVFLTKSGFCHVEGKMSELIVFTSPLDANEYLKKIREQDSEGFKQCWVPPAINNFFYICRGPYRYFYKIKIGKVDRSKFRHNFFPCNNKSFLDYCKKIKEGVIHQSFPALQFKNLNFLKENPHCFEKAVQCIGSFLKILTTKNLESVLLG